MWTGNTKYIYKNDLDKACFQHDMSCGKYKDLTKRTQSSKGLRDKAFEIRSNPEYDGYQRGLSSMIFKFYDKKYAAGSGVATLTNKSAIKSMSNQLQLADELHKPIIRKRNNRKVYSLFKDNIWGIDLADMQLISTCNKEIRYLLSAIDLFSKYVWVAPLKDKQGFTVVNAFESIFKSSKRKPNKILVDQSSAFYNSFFKK